MQHPKATNREGNRKCACGHARAEHTHDGRQGICRRLGCECEVFRRPAARAAGASGCGCDDAAGASCCAHAGDGPDAPSAKVSASLVAERMARWYEADRSPFFHDWKRCTVHGTLFATFCAGCADEFGIAAALAAGKFDSSPGEESNLRATAGDVVRSSVIASSNMPRRGFEPPRF